MLSCREEAMKRLTYRQAGVDLDKYDRLVPIIKRILAGSSTASGTGHFAGMIELRRSDGDILVASADGVGTKVKVAKAYGWHGGLGRDIVAHCTNDILCIGARPVAFLDYVAFDRLDREGLRPDPGGHRPGVQARRHRAAGRGDRRDARGLRRRASATSRVL